MKKTVLFDSYAWIEIFDDKIANKSLLQGVEIVASTINLYEVYSKYLKEDPDLAVEGVALMQSSSLVVPVTIDISLRAAELRQKYDFSMADSIILATAEIYNAEILTGDQHFKKVDEVKVNFL